MTEEWKQYLIFYKNLLRSGLTRPGSRDCVSDMFGLRLAYDGVARKGVIPRYIQCLSVTKYSPDSTYSYHPECLALKAFNLLQRII